MQDRPIVFIGSRDMLPDLIEQVELSGRTVEGFLDEFYVGQHIFGARCLGSHLDLLPERRSPEIQDLVDRCDFFVASVYLMGNETSFHRRLEMIDIVQRAGDIQLTNIIHPVSSVSKGATLGTNVYVGFCTTIQNGVRVGDFASVYHYAILSHHCSLGFNSLAHTHTGVASNVHIGNHCTLGMRSSFSHTQNDEYITVGDNTIVYSLTGIYRSIPENSIVLPNGKIVKNTKFDPSTFPTAWNPHARLVPEDR